MSNFFLPELEYLEQLAERAIAEELKWGPDETSNQLVGTDTLVRAKIVAQESGWLCGIPLVKVILQTAASRLATPSENKLTPPRIHLRLTDGVEIYPGAPVVEFTAPARAVLLAKQSLLNLLGRLSGITTATKAWTQALANSHTVVRDTNQTALGLREIEKYAVRVGQGMSSRLGLGSLPVVEAEHLLLLAGQACLDGPMPGKAGETTSDSVSVTTRVKLAELSQAEIVAQYAVAFQQLQVLREGNQPLPIQLTVRNETELEAALAVQPAAISLHGFTAEYLAEAVAKRETKAKGTLLEAVGDFKLSEVSTIANSGIDYLGLPNLTTSAAILPFELKLEYLSTNEIS